MGIKRMLPLSALTLAAVLAASGADAKIITEACKKDLTIGDYTFDSSRFSSDYTFTVVRFRETSRDSRFAYGVCTINFKYQPPD